MVLSAKHLAALFWTESGEKSFPFPHPAHGLTCALRRLDILSRNEGGPWMSFLALFRADPCLRLMKKLEPDLRRKVQLMTVRG